MVFIHFCLFTQIWWMVELSRAHLQDGHFALMWKDTTFNYAYFLWFEDASVSRILYHGGLLGLEEISIL